MGKLEAAKQMTVEEGKREIDSISALVEISQAGKLGQVETLVTQVAIMSKELKEAREEVVKNSREVANQARRLTEETTGEVKRANDELLHSLGEIQSVARQLDYVLSKPGWVTYLYSTFYALIGAIIMAFALYIVLPSYNALVSNQAAIYQSVEQLKNKK